MSKSTKKPKLQKKTDVQLTREEQEYLQQLLEAQIVRIEYLKSEKKAPKQLETDLELAQKVQSKVDVSYL
jgi:hypothetical protein